MRNKCWIRIRHFAQRSPRASWGYLEYYSWKSTSTARIRPSIHNVDRSQSIHKLATKPYFESVEPPFIISTCQMRLKWAQGRWRVSPTILQAHRLIIIVFQVCIHSYNIMWLLFMRQPQFGHRVDIDGSMREESWWLVQQKRDNVLSPRRGSW